MEQVKTNSAKAWLLAARPKTLSGASVPVMIGAAMAWHDAMAGFQWIAALLCFLFAFVMQIDANLINDYFDFRHGNDDETRLGPRRACAQGWITLPAMRYGIVFTTLLACLIGLPLICFGGWKLIWVGIVCVVFCFLYTTFLSYHGWGDVLVLVFFGIIPVCLTYYVSMPVESQAIPLYVFISSIACGFVIDTLLIVNNYRDRENDARAGKRTLVLRLGTANSERLYRLLGFVAICCNIVLILVMETSVSIGIRLWSVIALLIIYGGLHDHAYRRMKAIHQGKQLNTILGKTARNMFFYGVLVSAAYVMISLFSH